MSPQSGPTEHKHKGIFSGSGVRHFTGDSPPQGHLPQLMLDWFGQVVRPSGIRGESFYVPFMFVPLWHLTQVSSARYKMFGTHRPQQFGPDRSPRLVARHCLQGPAPRSPAPRGWVRAVGGIPRLPWREFPTPARDFPSRAGCPAPGANKSVPGPNPARGEREISPSGLMGEGCY
jgi:hypothetical protein